MLKLHGNLPVLNAVAKDSYLVTVTTNENLPSVIKRNRALLVQPNQDPRGFKALLTKEQGSKVVDSASDIFHVSDDYDYLKDGDIIRLDPSSGSIRSLYRKSSPHNTLLLTEQCDHYCLMCSQPPKEIDDSWLLREAFELISLIPMDTEALGFSGGEPTLYRDRLDLPGQIWSRVNVRLGRNQGGQGHAKATVHLRRDYSTSAKG